uniref:Serine/threonine protein kinases n=1 Tax=uncultured Cytophagia bacterium TaxID=768505 RepID=H6RE98_9BACT|nr:serine/threonine protein kinase [uncultured bacterium]CCF99359.1 serine/threonine protein kinases [uncultured Cytophagia bacterium]
MKILSTYLCLLALLISFSSKAQVNLDSLWSVWNDKTQPDTNRLKAMNKIAWDGYLFSQPDSAFYFAQMQYDFALSVNNKRFMAHSISTQGVSFAIRGNYEKSLEYFLKTLEIRKEIDDKKGMGDSCNNIGNIYDDQGNYEKALEYHSQSLAINKEIGNKEGMGVSYNSIGFIYSNQGNYEKALAYYLKSLRITEELGDKNGIGDSYNNIGLIYSSQGNYEKALEFYLKSLGIDKELSNKNGMACSYNNIGIIYKYQGNYEKALEYYLKSLAIDKDLGDIKGIGDSNNNIGLFYKDQGNYKKALDYLLKSKNIKQEINTIQGLDETSEALSEVYKKLGKYKQALEMQELYMETKDSIAKMDAEEELYKFEVDKEYQLKKQADSILHADEIIIQQVENLAKEEQLKSEKQRRTGLLVIVGLVLMSLGFVFVQLRKTKAQKVVIENQHARLNESHREITDSINYAKRIQDALMTSAVYIKDVLPESFILFKPKDVVSGDFYWVYRSPKGQIYFTVADCTGHGVPGAFMSMIGTSLLNEFIIENNIEDTAEVLTKMRAQIIKSLDQKGLQGENKDGMDMALCKYDPKKGTVQYSGAYNPLIHISKNEINQLKGDSQPVGLHTGKKLPFTNKEIEVSKGDMLYIYSDGFPDQFGGEKGKKYLSGKFKNFLLSISDKPIDEQNTLIEEEFTNWIGDHEQIDDVCVMGLRIT